MISDRLSRDDIKAICLMTKQNQKLEFLGDSYVNLAAAKYLFRRYPDQNEEMFTNFKLELIKTSALATLARHIGLDGETDRQLEDRLEITAAYLVIVKNISDTDVIQWLIELYRVFKFEDNYSPCAKLSLQHMLQRGGIEFKWLNRKILPNRKVVGRIEIDGELFEGEPANNGLDSEMELARKILADYQLE
jgi:hypothetical protein